MTLNKNTITTVPLNTVGESSNGDTDNPVICSIQSDGGVKILEPGWYLVSGSAYISCNAITGSNMRSVYLYKGTEEIASGTENTFGSNSTHLGAIGFPSRLVRLNREEVLYLKARSQTIAGTVSASNACTHLTLVRLGW